MSNSALSKDVVLDRPPTRRPLLGYLTLATALLAIAGGIWAYEAGYASTLFKKPQSLLQFIEVDKGEVVEFIVENGTLESASNTIVRCEVEALMGMVGGTNAMGAGGAAGAAGRSGTAAGTAQGGTAAGGAQAGATGGAVGGGASMSASSSKSRASSKVKSGSTTKSAGGSTSTASSSSGSGGGAGGSAGSGAASATGGTATVSSKPMIRSFSYMVTPHMPLKGAMGKSSTTTAAKSGQDASMGGGRGGRGGSGGGGNRGGRGGGGMMDEEKPGSTRIVSILPEGTQVKKGQLVCELDSAAFRDELQAQSIRVAQAKSWVDQARAIFEVNQITQREYRDGIFPQDMELIRQYIQTCNIEKDRAEKNLIWTRDVTAKGLQTQAQLKAAELNYQQASIAAEEAAGMLVRLEKFTGPKILKSLEAKIKAIESDRRNQDASFELETQRLARLQKCIDGCTLVAPEDGVVVYYQQTNGWGRVEQGIEQGVTVREGQPIFQLPDPKKMRVKARINETKYSQIRTGQRAIVRIDAFPDRPLVGTVAEITAIATPINGPFSDVRIYFATVNIDAGFEDLRPGLTAEVMFRSNSKSDVPRVPIESIRFQDGKYFVAVQSSSQGKDGLAGWRWTEVELGLSDPDFAEIRSGIKQGDRIVANPRSLPAPEGIPAERSQTATVATASLNP